MLTPSSDDKNRSAELKRMQEDPSSFGAHVLPDNRDLTGSGLVVEKITLETISANKLTKKTKGE
jgi:hypothetical protein